VLFEKHADDKIEPASTTKIMTCILALEKASMDAEVTVSRNAARMRGSSLELKENEKVKMNDLLNGMMMFSGNDAATAVAEHISGDVAAFVDLMNAKAQALGMKDTHFVNPHGMHDENHVTTARDMAVLARYSMSNPAFASIIRQESYTLPKSNMRPEKTYKNTNLLMRSDNDGYYSYAIGGKTGSTTQAGHCLVAMASKEGMNLISLIFKDDSKEGRNRWPMAKDLFDYGFTNYITIDLQKLLDNAPPVQVQIENYASSDRSHGLLEFERPQSVGTLVTIDRTTAEGIKDPDTIEIETAYVHTLQAPVLKGEVLGTVTYKSTATGETIYQGSLIATRDVLQAGTEPDASGATAVTVVPPINIEELKPNDNIYYWLLIPAALIVFLVVRLLTVTRRKRKRFNKRRPHYSYRIR